MKSGAIQLILIAILLLALFFLRQTLGSISQDAAESVNGIELADTEVSDEQLEPLDEVELILPDTSSGSAIGIISADNIVDTDEELAQEILQDQNNDGISDTDEDQPTPIGTIETQSVGGDDDANSSQYVAYNSLQIRSAVGEGKKVILFFYAPWDPSSIGLDGSLTSEQDLIPSDVVIFRTNFDDQTLKDNYGVTKQRTMILLDTEGEELARSADILAVDQLADFVGE